jgi:transposase
MAKTVRARYTLEFKREAVRLVEGGQSLAAAARTLGVLDQTLFNWVKAMLNKYPKFAFGPRKLLI